MHPSSYGGITRIRLKGRNRLLPLSLSIQAPLRPVLYHNDKGVSIRLNEEERFDEDFRFQLTRGEVEQLSISQNVTAIQTRGIKGGRAKLPWAFGYNIEKKQPVQKFPTLSPIKNDTHSAGAHADKGHFCFQTISNRWRTCR